MTIDFMLIGIRNVGIVLCKSRLDFYYSGFVNLFLSFLLSLIFYQNSWNLNFVYNSIRTFRLADYPLFSPGFYIQPFFCHILLLPLYIWTYRREKSSPKPQMSPLHAKWSELILCHWFANAMLNLMTLWQFIFIVLDKCYNAQWIWNILWAFSIQVH